MRSFRQSNMLIKVSAHRILLSFIILTLILLSGCDFSFQEDESLQQTKNAIAIEQTLEARKQNRDLANTAQAQETALENQIATLTARSVIDPTVDLNATQFANSMAETQQSIQNTQAAIPNPTVTTQPTNTIDLQSMMKSANILLYEDIIYDPGAARYAQKALDELGLSYVDVGSAKGWFKEQLLSGGPDGSSWDLIIIAAEAKSGVSGEFFEYVSQALDQGASVILEVWYLDSTYSGTASNILSRCGVQFEKDWFNIPPSQMYMFPVDQSHPIMQEPNSGLSFTDTTSYWWDEEGPEEYDIGDWMKLSSTGDAKILVGTLAGETSTHGTVAVCINDRLIIQTFSSHQLTYNAMGPVWQNYIYNALKARFQGS